MNCLWILENATIKRAVIEGKRPERLRSAHWSHLDESRELVLSARTSRSKNVNVLLEIRYCITKLVSLTSYTSTVHQGQKITV